MLRSSAQPRAHRRVAQGSGFAPGRNRRRPCVGASIHYRQPATQRSAGKFPEAGTGATATAALPRTAGVLGGARYFTAEPTGGAAKLENSESYRDSQNLHRIMSRHDFATAIAVAGLS